MNVFYVTTRKTDWILAEKHVSRELNNIGLRVFSSTNVHCSYIHLLVSAQALTGFSTACYYDYVFSNLLIKSAVITFIGKKIMLIYTTQMTDIM